MFRFISAQLRRPFQQQQRSAAGASHRSQQLLVAGWAFPYHPHKSGGGLILAAATDSRRDDPFFVGVLSVHSRVYCTFVLF